MLFLPLLAAVGNLAYPAKGEDSLIARNGQSVGVDISIGVDSPGTVSPPPTATAVSAGSPTATHMVDVGADDLLLFTPNHVFAWIGDVVEFHFHRFNHTLTESSFEKPCVAIGQFDTGFTRAMSVEPEHPDFVAFTVRDWNSHWFFCRQILPRSHCDAGMVFGLNPGDKMQQFLDNANPPGVGTGTATVYSTGMANSIRAVSGTGTGTGTGAISPTMATEGVWSSTFNPQASSRTPSAPTASFAPFTGGAVSHCLTVSVWMAQLGIWLLLL